MQNIKSLVIGTLFALSMSALAACGGVEPIKDDGNDEATAGDTTGTDTTISDLVVACGPNSVSACKGLNAGAICGKNRTGRMYCGISPGDVTNTCGCAN